MKFCKDCRWAKPQAFLFMARWEFAHCMNPEVNKDRQEFAVAGKDGMYCSIARKYECGIEESKFFEDRNSTDKQIAREMGVKL